MTAKQFICAMLVAAMVLAPADAEARKKKKKYEKKTVNVEQAVASEPTPQPVTVTDPARQLYGEWNIETIRRKPALTRERAYIYLDFKSHKVYGNNGCNSLNGSFSQRGTDISFHDMITTSNTCHSGTNERTVMKTLAEVQRFQLSRQGDVEWLTLTNAKDQPLMTLRRQNLDFLDGVWLVSEAGGNDITAQNVRLVIDANMLTIHGNTGCNIINGIITIDPTKRFAIQFEDLHSSGNNSENIDIETAVLVALEQTVTCRRLDDQRAALIDEKGNTTMVLTHITLR